MEAAIQSLQVNMEQANARTMGVEGNARELQKQLAVALTRITGVEAKSEQFDGLMPTMTARVDGLERRVGGITVEQHEKVHGQVIDLVQSTERITQDVEDIRARLKEVKEQSMTRGAGMDQKRIDKIAESPHQAIFEGAASGGVAFREWAQDLVYLADQHAQGLAAAMRVAQTSKEEVTKEKAKEFGATDAEDSTLRTALLRYVKGPAKHFAASRAATSGLELWRQMNANFDPVTVTAAMTSSSHLMNPPQCKTRKELGQAIAEWEHDMAQYESRSSSDDYLTPPWKMAAIWKMVPAADQLLLRDMRLRCKSPAELVKELMAVVAEDAARAQAGVGLSAVSHGTNEGPPDGTEMEAVNPESGQIEIYRLVSGKWSSTGVKGRKMLPSRPGGGPDKSKVECHRCGKLGRFKDQCKSLTTADGTRLPGEPPGGRMEYGARRPKDKAALNLEAGAAAQEVECGSIQLRTLEVGTCERDEWHHGKDPWRRHRNQTAGPEAGEENGDGDEASRCQPCGEDLCQCRWCLGMGFCTEYQRPTPLMEIYSKVVTQSSPPMLTAAASRPSPSMLAPAPSRQDATTMSPSPPMLVTQSSPSMLIALPPEGYDTPLCVGQPAPPRSKRTTLTDLGRSQVTEQVTPDTGRNGPSDQVKGPNQLNQITEELSSVRPDDEPAEESQIGATDKVRQALEKMKRIKQMMGKNETFPAEVQLCPLDSGEQWRRVLLTLDSGAGKSVTTTDVATGYRILETAASKSGQVFVGPGSERYPNKGQVKLRMKTEAGQPCTGDFAVAQGVEKTLAAVSDSCDRNNIVAFDNDLSAVVPRDCAEGVQIRRLIQQCKNKIEVQRQNGVYVLPVWVKAPSESGFTGPEK